MLMIVGDNSIPISWNHLSIHATFYYSQGSEVKYNTTGLDISFFEISADCCDFVNLTVGFFVIG